MKRIIFSKAYISSGWADNVYMEINENGLIHKIIPNHRNDSAKLINGYALPGINNIHSHAFQRAMAGLAEYTVSVSDSFWTWRDLMYRFAERITVNDLKIIAAQLYMEMLKAGYVTVSEFHYLHRDNDQDARRMSYSIFEAANDTGIGLCHLPVLYMHSGFGGAPLTEKQIRFGFEAENYLKLRENLTSDLKNNLNQHVGMAFHSLRAVSETAIKECLADSKDGPIHIHIAEQIKEVEDCLKWSGKRPVEWLYNNINIDDKWCLIHATHLTEAEIKMVSDSGAVVGLCPTTEANLGDGIFPLQQYFSSGGEIAIGSDSHISVSVIEELRLLEYSQRLKYQRRNIAANDRQIHTGTNLLIQCLKGGAKASGFNNGSLEIGKRADIIVIDDKSPLLTGTPDQNIIDRFIFNGNVNPVKHVFVAGDHVISNYKHKKESDITEEFVRTMNRFKKYLD